MNSTIHILEEWETLNLADGTIEKQHLNGAGANGSRREKADPQVLAYYHKMVGEVTAARARLRERANGNTEALIAAAVPPHREEVEGDIYAVNITNPDTDAWFVKRYGHLQPLPPHLLREAEKYLSATGAKGFGY